MAKKTVISKVLDAEAVDGIIEFPQNKTLYVDQFTDMAPIKPGEVFQPETMEDVFERYQPEKRNVQMLDLEGRPVKENFKFNAIKDFDDKELIKQSMFLGQQKASQTAAFLDFAGGEARRLMSASSSQGERKDCRNSMLGIISGIELGMRSVRVEMTAFSDIRLIALCSHKDFSRLDLHLNQVVTAFIDPDQITVAPESHSSGFSNCLCGRVEELHREQVETFLGVSLSDGTKVYSHQETAVLDRMRLHERKKLWLFFPARAVKLSLH